MRRYLFSILLLFGACAGPDRGEEALKVAQAVFEAFNAHDWKKMESLYADDVEMIDPSFEGVRKGKTGMTDFYRSVPDIHDDIRNIFASGNQVVIEFVSTGTTDGQAFQLAICTVLTVQNGKVVKDHTYYDNQ